MTRGRRGETGMVTAEIAVALPALVLVLTLGLGAVAVVTDQLRCVDAARVGARLLARGEPVEQVRNEVARQAPDGAEIGFEVGPDSVRVDVSAQPPPLLRAVGVSARPRGVAHAVPEAAP
ncbi:MULTISPECIES: TadE family type IV pilus minor pilin [unclassified Knoellia]|uniref:TadE family type IV pilus minor pilin n=1 Tax=Knoellia altitudinis TaxID=3404795 RepID=UPI00362403A8